MLRSIVVSRGQRASKRCGHGKTESEMTIPHGDQRFYLPAQSLDKSGPFAYLRANNNAAIVTGDRFRSIAVGVVLLLRRVAVGVDGLG